MAFDSCRGRLVLFGGRDVEPLNQTWEWDGQAWLQRESSSAPPARTGHAMAFDEVTRRVVLFGGTAADGSLRNDTWEWDGNEWSMRLPATQPAGRTAHAMAYDAARQRVVCFGGNAIANLADTWLWDGLDWTLQTPAMTPPGRSEHAMAYDRARGRVVLYGGAPNDTWEWDGTNWQQAPGSAGGPPVRYRHGMAYDPVRQRTVLHGGGHFVQILPGVPTFTPRTDTWEYDGATWTQVVSSVVPGDLRHSFAMAFDANRQRVVALGGESGPAGAAVEIARAHWEWDGTIWRRALGLAPGFPSSFYGGVNMAYDEARDCVVHATVESTWEFRGVTWSETPNSPLPRSGCSLVYDAANQRTVLFGGRDPSSALRGETMLWDGIAWSTAAPAVAPVAREGHVMVFDRARARVVLFGGRKQTPSIFVPGIDNETWEWDGSAWTQRAPAVSPPARTFAGAAYDSQRNVTVLYGGELGFLSFYLDTWEWDGANWQQRVTANNPGGHVRPAMVYDANQQRTVLIGASGGTWGFDGANWSQQATGGPGAVFAAYDSRQNRVVALSSSATRIRSQYAPATAQSGGVACGGPGGLPLAAGPLPYLGNPRFRVEILGAPSGAACLFGLSVAQLAQPIGAGCTLYLDQIVSLEAAAANSSGHAEALALEVPYAPALRGLSLHTQGLALDPTAPLGFAMTGWRTLTCGD
jgi:hypothetical protein